MSLIQIRAKTKANKLMHNFYHRNVSSVWAFLFLVDNVCSYEFTLNSRESWKTSSSKIEEKRRDAEKFGKRINLAEMDN